MRWSTNHYSRSPCLPSAAAGRTRRTSRPHRRQPEDDPDLDPNPRSPTSRWSTCRPRCACRGSRARFASPTASAGRSAQGDFGNLAEDFFGLDSGAQIGLEYRFGLMRGWQAGIHRTSDRTIEFFTQYNVLQQARRRPIGLSVIASIDGTNNFTDSYTPALGVVVSRELGDYGARLPRADLGEQLEPAAVASWSTTTTRSWSASAPASASGRPSIWSANSFRALGYDARRVPRHVRHREAGRRAHVPAQLLQRLRHDDGPDRARRHRRTTTGTSASTSRESSSDDAISTRGGRRARRCWRSALPACGGDSNPTEPAGARADGGDRRHRSRATITITSSGRVAAGHHGRRRVARHVRQQRHAAARHVVGSASGAYRLPGDQRSASSAAGPERHDAEPEHGPDVQLPRPQSADATRDLQGTIRIQ